MKNLDEFMKWLEKNNLITINECSGRDTWQEDLEQFQKEEDEK